MPELPEVETTRLGLEPILRGQRIASLEVRNPRLRWPIAPETPDSVKNQRILGLERRGKYLLIRLERGTLIVHLGMSGSLRVVSPDARPGPHDHWDLELPDGRRLRLRDPRRFGALLWTAAPPHTHPLLKRLGPEPLENGFDGDYLYQQGRRHRIAVKTLIMDSRIVVGVGNIYANEALFASRIRPQRDCGRISLHRYEVLADSIREVLNEAIAQGGTTLRDFVRDDGQPGYFAQRLQVYGRTGEPCPACEGAIRQTRTGQRSTFYCPRCQR